MRKRKRTRSRRAPQGFERGTSTRVATPAPRAVRRSLREKIRARREAIERAGGTREYGLPALSRDRGDRLSSPTQPAQHRLQARKLPARTRNADAPSRKAAVSCKRAKSERRAVIIATGHGGINNARNYRARSKC